jgi:hypothetical protein
MNDLPIVELTRLMEMLVDNACPRTGFRGQKAKKPKKFNHIIIII